MTATTALYSTNTLAAIFDVKPATIRAWSRSGKLPPPLRQGNRLLWLPDEIRTVLEKLRAESSIQPNEENSRAHP
jgi:predicted site-specific integrase-resolvase